MPTHSGVIERCLATIYSRVRGIQRKNWRRQQEFLKQNWSSTPWSRNPSLRINAQREKEHSFQVKDSCFSSVGCGRAPCVELQRDSPGGSRKSQILSTNSRSFRCYSACSDQKRDRLANQTSEVWGASLRAKGKCHQWAILPIWYKPIQRSTNSGRVFLGVFL